jgi:hypothetical protein
MDVPFRGGHWVAGTPGADCVRAAGWCAALRAAVLCG